MCLCGVLGAESGSLPPEVAGEARRFFRLAAQSIARAPGVAEPAALRTLATLEGALLVARVLDDPAAFEQATAGLP
jgi:TetR/AcrR family transcriptional repressor of nem operon